MVGPMLITEENYLLFKDFLMAVFGGFVGAVFSLIATKSIIIEGAFFIVMYYAIFTLLGLFIFKKFTKMLKTDINLVIYWLVVVFILILIVVWLFF